MNDKQLLLELSELRKQYFDYDDIEWGRGYRSGANIAITEVQDLVLHEMYSNEDCHWLWASDGDGYVCPKCGRDYCIMLEHVIEYKYCPVCGIKLLPPIGEAQDED